MMISASKLQGANVMINLDTTVDKVLDLYPRLGGWFIHKRMHCVGCDIAQFHTLTDVAQVYAMDPRELQQQLQLWLDSDITPENRGDV